MSHHAKQVSLPNWRTPSSIRGRVWELFGHDFLDPATDLDNPMEAEVIFTEKENGLGQVWGHERVFCNPPWSKKLGMPIEWWTVRFWEYAQELGRMGGQLITVTPASVNAKWFHGHILQAVSAICLPEGRVAYELPVGFENNQAPSFDTAISYFGPYPDEFIEVFRDFGWAQQVSYRRGLPQAA